jgi:putative oxidoreductase
VQGILCLVGRVLLCTIFLISGAGHVMQFKDLTEKAMPKVGIPQPQVMLAGAIAFLIVGGVSVVIGYKARVGAVLLAVFLVLATFYFHDFWNVNVDRVKQQSQEVTALSEEALQKQAAKEKQDQMINFLKNTALLGAMLFIMANGAGHWSVDAYLARKPGTAPAA